MYTRYLIVGYSRSGTTVAHLALMGHPNVAALNDELTPAPFFSEGMSTFTHGNDLAVERETGHRALFDALTSIRANERTLALGAKTANNSPAAAQRIVDVLQRHLPEMKVVHVVRRDIVAQFGSAQYGAKSGVMHSWNPGAVQRTIRPIRIAKWRFLPYALNVLRMNQVLRELARTHDVYELTYEEYVKNPHASHTALFDFIGVPTMAADWLKSEKLLPPPESYISNYAEMTRRLRSLEQMVATDSLPTRTLWQARIAGRLGHVLGTPARWRRRVRTLARKLAPRQEKSLPPQQT